MARYTEAVCKLCRREGQKLFLKGQRCYTDKCALNRRAYAPGQHGQGRKKTSEYGMQLRAKQVARRYYGVLEGQFRAYYGMATKMEGKTGENLLSVLESRLDNVVYRLGWASSRAEARQLVVHGHFNVNGKRVDIPSYLTRVGEVISIRASYLQNAGILEKDASSWRFVSSQGGISYCFSDLGVQTYQLIAFVTQLTPTRVSGCLSRTYTNRTTDDNGCALLQMKEGVFCDIHASKTSLLHDNFLSIEVDGTTGAIHWDLDSPNQLIYQRIHMNKQVLTPDSPPVMDHLRGRYNRLPRGHAEVGQGSEIEA